MRGEDNGLESRRADFVDGYGFDRGGETGEYGSLASWSLADVALQDIAHVDVCDLGNGDFGFLESGFDGYGAKFGGRDCEEGAIELFLLA